MKKVVWGVLSTAKIGVKQVIPAMQLSPWCDMRAIASRSLPAAQAAFIRFLYGLIILLPTLVPVLRNGLPPGTLRFILGRGVRSAGHWTG